MEISRLAIDEKYRRNPLVLGGLFTWCNNCALANYIDFVIATGFSYVVPLYKRLAFELIYPKGHEKYAVKMPNGFTMHPLILNFSDLVLNKNNVYQQKFGSYPFTDKHFEQLFIMSKNNHDKELFSHLEPTLFNIFL